MPNASFIRRQRGWIRKGYAAIGTPIVPPTDPPDEEDPPVDPPGDVLIGYGVTPYGQNYGN